jgi:hypothetical protein
MWLQATNKTARVMIGIETRFMLQLARDYSIRKRMAPNRHHRDSIPQIADQGMNDPSRTARWSQ